MNIIEVDGKWQVVEGELVLHEGSTNAEAWRWLDRHEGSPVSRSEKVSQWMFDAGIHDPWRNVPRSKPKKRFPQRRSPRARHAYRIGKLGAASAVRHLVKDGNPVEQAR
jgi:hypothetical protein